jgi:hypothetical protein
MLWGIFCVFSLGDNLRLLLKNTKKQIKLQMI